MATQTFEKAREGLIKLIELRQPQGSFRNKITVVFDGKPGIWNVRSSVEVIFTYEKSADERIKDAVEQARNKKEIVVVTNDREIQYAVRSSGAKVLSVEDFGLKLEQPAKKTAAGRGNDKEPREARKYIPTVTEFKINEEMKKVWLNKGKKT